MKIKELQTIVDSTEWTFLKKGTYNRVSVSVTKLTIDGFTGQWVLKTPRRKEDALSESTRAVRKWNALNPDYPAFKTEKGWMAPYLGDTPASDEQISNKLIDIYRRTRNIIFDAYVDGNFLLYNGEVICIDVDQSLRRGSIASDRWHRENSPGFNQHFRKKFGVNCALRIAVIETLLYLEENIPDEDIKEEYITSSMISKLHNFRQQKKPITVEIMETLLKIESVDPANEIKDKYLTPLVVETLSSLQIITKDSLSRLINNQLLELAHPGDIVRMGDLDDVIILLKFKKALLYQVDKEGFTLLHIAAMLGYTEIARYLLAEGAPVDTVTQTDSPVNSNMTALDLAICHGKDTTANLLLEAGGTISPIVCNKFEYLCFCAKNGLLERVRLFIECDPLSIHAKDNFNQTALFWAAFVGQHEIVEFFITKGADVNTATQLPANYKHLEGNNWAPLDWAIKEGHTATALTLLKAGAVANHVHRAIRGKTLEQLIREGDLDCLQILLNHNKALLNQIDTNGYAPVHYAAFYGQIKITRYLITAGADLNTVTVATERTRFPNMTAMDIILFLKKHDMVAILLLEAGARVSPALNGEYHVIHLATKNGEFSLIKTLVARYPELIHVTDCMNQTPLLWAASKGYNEIVKFFIAQGANVNIATQLPANHRKYQEENNRSPLDWAIKGGHTTTASTLIQAGAVANTCTDDSINQVTKNLVKLSIFQSISPRNDADITDEEMANFAFERGENRAQ